MLYLFLVSAGTACAVKNINIRRREPLPIKQAHEMEQWHSVTAACEETEAHLVVCKGGNGIDAPLWNNISFITIDLYALPCFCIAETSCKSNILFKLWHYH